LHILFVWPYLHYPEVAMEFLQKIRDRGHRVSVLLAKMDGSIQTKFFNSKIDFHFAPSWNIISRFTRTPYPVFRSASTYVKAVNPDVVHVNSHLFLCNYQVIKAAYSMGIPSVVTVHGFMAERGFVLDTLQEIYLRLVGREIFRKVSAVICLTKEDAASVARIVGNYKKISIIPNGVDVELFKPSLFKDSNLITWVGRFVPEKGLIYLLKAMKRIVRDCRDAHLVLIGDGSVKNNFVNLSRKLGLDSNVFFLGTVNRREVARLLSRSSIFVFPSLREGMPMALLEAMSSGNAVVASNIKGIAEIMRDNVEGMLIPVKNPKELASHILTLSKNTELRHKLGDNARRAVMDRYSWNSVLAKLDNLYDYVVSEKS